MSSVLKNSLLNEAFPPGGDLLDGLVADLRQAYASRALRPRGRGIEQEDSVLLDAEVRGQEADRRFKVRFQ